MIEFIAAILDFILQVTILVMAARSAAPRMPCWQMMAFACGVSAVFGVLFDFQLSFVFSSYTQDEHVLMQQALFGAPFDAAIAYAVTRRLYARRSIDVIELARS
jgi:cystathionine beta-lyase/cystathionine gamma-synthase